MFTKHSMGLIIFKHKQTKPGNVTKTHETHTIRGNFSWNLSLPSSRSRPNRLLRLLKMKASDCWIWGPQWGVELRLSEALNFISLRLFLEPQWGFEFKSLRSCFLPQWDRNLCDTFVNFDTDVKNSLHVPSPHWEGISPHMACFLRPDFLKSEVWFFKIWGRVF